MRYIFAIMGVGAVQLVYWLWGGDYERGANLGFASMLSVFVFAGICLAYDGFKNRG